MKYLVTGGTGFLGEHVCRRLRADGHDVRALARSRSDVLTDLGVELVRGDVMGDAAFLREAMRGVDGVFHLAGLVSRDPEDSQRMMRLHVDGTRNVLLAMENAGVARAVVASTSGTIAVSKDQTLHDEASPYATEVALKWPYYASKIYQEKLAFSLGRERGLDVIAVLPSLLLGPGDRRGSSTEDVARFLRGQTPAVPSGGINFVDARDAADATVVAMAEGVPGQRYLLGGPNWTMKEFFGRMARLANVSEPRLRLPDRVARIGASLMEEGARMLGRTPSIERSSVEMAQHYWWFESTKAERALRFEARDPQLTLVDTIADIRALWS